VNPDVTVTVVQGFGTGRDGSFAIGAPPPYQATVGLDLLHYEHVQLAYKKYIDVGLHFNTQWTRDPHLHQQETPTTGFTKALKAHFTTFGGEVSLSVPRAGRLWISPSVTRVRNGWALANAGVEVMHSLSAAGFATNYLGYDNSADDSTGSGSSFNLGFLYENSLSGIQGKPRGTTLPDVTLNVFGLMMNASLDLPPRAPDAAPKATEITQNSIKQLKYGADASVQILDWLGFMLRYDEVNYDLDHSGYIFSAISPRLTVSSHFLSSERIYIQYSRYRYGDKMVLAGRWPWGLDLIAGNHITQGSPYTGHKPDMDVIRFQAEVAF
jgi:hypothetical protein